MYNNAVSTAEFQPRKRTDEHGAATAKKSSSSLSARCLSLRFRGSKSLRCIICHCLRFLAEIRVLTFSPERGYFTQEQLKKRTQRVITHFISMGGFRRTGCRIIGFRQLLITQSPNLLISDRRLLKPDRQTPNRNHRPKKFFNSTIFFVLTLR